MHCLAGQRALALTLQTSPVRKLNGRFSAGEILTPATPLTLQWDNGAGLLFNRTYAIDDNYMFTVTQSVENTGDVAASMVPYGLLARHGEPKDLKNFFVLHEGLVTMTDEYSETDWDDIPDFTIHPKEGVPAERIDKTRVQRLDWHHGSLLDDHADP